MRTAKTLIRLGDVQAELSLRWMGAEVIFVGLAAHVKASHAIKKVLNSVSSQCARGKSTVARKTEVDPKTSKW